MSQLTFQYRNYCDVETSGFDPIRNDVISLALVVTDRELNVKGEFYETAKPEFNKFYSEEAEKIHGFRQRDMYKFQSRRQLCENLLKFLKPFKSEINVPNLFVQHALGQFDYKFIEWAFRKEELQYELWKVLRQDYQRSTITEARKLGFKNNKLNEWADRLEIHLNHHIAIEDARLCMEVDKFLLNNSGFIND
jgi:DNA polymerase III epsilon subunit-like protein